MAGKITNAIYLILQGVALRDDIDPPEAKVRFVVTRAPKSAKFMISIKSPPETDVATRTLKVAQHAGSILRLQELLAELPTQYPGAPDMYGRDTSIVHITEHTRLAELYRLGPEAAEGIPLPTEEQKVKFDEAIAIIENWGS